MLPFADAERSDPPFSGSTGRVAKRVAIVAAVVLGAGALAGVGCARSGTTSPDSAGRFFRQAGPLTLLHHESGGEASKPAFAETDPTPSAQTPTIPDSKIRLDLARRFAEAEIPVSELTLEVDDQRVLVRGVARSPRARDRVELLARSHEGVRAVDNRLRLHRRPASEGNVLDDPRSSEE